MTRYHFVFWEPSVSPHKLALFAALRERPETAGCTYVAQEALPAERAAQGWSLADTSGLDIRVAPTASQCASLFDPSPGVTKVHLFSGLRRVPVIRFGLRQAIRRGEVFGIMSEPRVSEGWRGRLRLLQSWLTEGQVRRSFTFVLAIGRNGPPWFASAGYPPARIHTFAYFLAPFSQVPRTQDQHPPVVAYVGRLVEQKGIRLFLDAAERLRDLRVLVAGAGPLAEEVAARVDRLPAARFLGVVPMAEVPALLAQIDVLVQPSLTTDDGWGAIVSEALLAGAKVVATPQVGASILLDDLRRGMVAAAADADAVAQAVQAAVRVGLDGPARQARADWAASVLTGAAGAARVVAVVDHAIAGAPPPPPFPPVDVEIGEEDAIGRRP